MAVDFIGYATQLYEDAKKKKAIQGPANNLSGVTLAEDLAANNGRVTNINTAARGPVSTSDANPTGSGSSDTSTAGAFAPAKPGLMTAEEIAQLYGGVTYNQDDIYNKFAGATKAQYDMLNKQYAMTEGKFANNLYAAQGTALDAIRKSNAAAVATGASRGMQAANELSAILGLEQSSVAEATQLAQDRNLLADKEAAAYAKNIVDALTTSNEMKTKLGTLGQQAYAADTQFSVGEMDYQARLATAIKSLEGVLASAEATKYTANQNLAGNQYTADKNNAGVMYTADANLAGNKAVADANLKGTMYNADSNKTSNMYTADSNKASQMYSADQSLKGQQAYANGMVGAAQVSAAATKAAASISAAATRDAASTSAAAYKQNPAQATQDYADIIDGYFKLGTPAAETAFKSMVTANGKATIKEANEMWIEGVKYYTPAVPPIEQRTINPVVIPTGPPVGDYAAQAEYYKGKAPADVIRKP